MTEPTASKYMCLAAKPIDLDGLLLGATESVQVKITDQSGDFDDLTVDRQDAYAPVMAYAFVTNDSLDDNGDMLFLTSEYTGNRKIVSLLIGTPVGFMVPDIHYDALDPADVKEDLTVTLTTQKLLSAVLESAKFYFENFARIDFNKVYPQLDASSISVKIVVPKAQGSFYKGVAQLSLSIEMPAEQLKVLVTVLNAQSTKSEGLTFKLTTLNNDHYSETPPVFN